MPRAAWLHLGLRASVPAPSLQPRPRSFVECLEFLHAKSQAIHANCPTHCGRMSVLLRRGYRSFYNACLLSLLLSIAKETRQKSSPPLLLASRLSWALGAKASTYFCFCCCAEEPLRIAEKLRGWSPFSVHGSAKILVISL